MPQEIDRMLFFLFNLLEILFLIVDFTMLSLFLLTLIVADLICLIFNIFIPFGKLIK